MRAQSFYNWIVREIASSRLALISMYERRDKLLYIEAPALRKKYMETIGVHEEKVLEAELEVSLLRHKAELIQIALNRREKPDLEKIEALLDQEKTGMLQKLEDSDKTINEMPRLEGEDKALLQRRYHNIISSFHPAMNPSMTESQKELYQKAQDAYRNQNLDEMNLIYDMLFAKEEWVQIDSSDDKKYAIEAVTRVEYRTFVNELSTDYKLAKRLYDLFLPVEEDSVVFNTLEEYKKQQAKLEKELEEIKAGFPFNAEETLNSKRKTDEYLADIRARSRQCGLDRQELSNKIERLLEGM